MRESLYFQLTKKGAALAFLATALAALTLLPVYAQEDISPAEETQNEGDSSLDVAGAETSAKPVLWKNEKSGQLYANSGVRFILNATDNLSKTDYIEYKVDDSDYIRYSAPISISKEGPHSISYRAVDRAGNREFEQSFNVIVDNTSPEVELTPARAFIEKDGRLFTSPGNTFTIRAVDQHAGVKDINYGVNSGNKEKYEEGRIVQLSDPGSQLIQYEAIDNLGNRTLSGSVLVDVDNTRPRIAIRPTQPLRQVNGDRYARRATGFNVTAEDEGAGVTQVMVRIDGSQEWQAYNNTLYFSTETQHSIEAKALDAVGNESEVVVSRFKVDDNPPITKLRTSISAEPGESEE